MDSSEIERTHREKAHKEIIEEMAAWEAQIPSPFCMNLDEKLLTIQAPSGEQSELLQNKLQFRLQ